MGPNIGAIQTLEKNPESRWVTEWATMMYRVVNDLADSRSLVHRPNLWLHQILSPSMLQGLLLSKNWNSDLQFITCTCTCIHDHHWFYLGFQTQNQLLYTVKRLIFIQILGKLLGMVLTLNIHLWKCPALMPCTSWQEILRISCHIPARFVLTAD